MSMHSESHDHFSRPLARHGTMWALLAAMTIVVAGCGSNAATPSVDNVDPPDQITYFLWLLG